MIRKAKERSPAGLRGGARRGRREGYARTGDLVLSRPLGRVERGVGRGDQLPLARLVRERRDAEARRHVQLVAGLREDRTLLEGGAQPLGEVLRALHVRARQEDRGLPAAPARAEVDLAYR